jgi:hypothetical protein
MTPAIPLCRCATCGDTLEHVSVQDAMLLVPACLHCLLQAAETNYKKGIVEGVRVTTARFLIRGGPF